MSSINIKLLIDQLQAINEFIAKHDNKYDNRYADKNHNHYGQYSEVGHTHTTIDNDLTVNGTVHVNTGATNPFYITNPNLAVNGNEPIYVRQYGYNGVLSHSATILDKSGNTSFPKNLSVGGTLTATSVELNDITVIVSPTQITPTVDTNTYKYVFPISIASASVSFEFKLSDGTPVTINAVAAPGDGSPVTVTITGGTNLLNYIKYYDSTFTMEISFKNDVTVSDVYPVTTIKVNLLTQLLSQQGIINNLLDKIAALETRIAALESPTE